ncbi:MAG TPA: acyl-CoA dehydrogenase family protein [Acidimicrobiales bacterium]|jgi:alkylation response protein AidB-like acyl-CoA dehydrogenase
MATTTTTLEVELGGWLERHWDPDLTVAEWWELLGTSGWAAPTWPTDWFGRGLSRADAAQVQQTIAGFGALSGPTGLGLSLAGPTIIAHGSEDQKRQYVRDIATGQRAWCQLFSEPGAGSDLAGLQTRAVPDGDEWRVDGQKVWTSGGQFADLGMLLARTDADVPKHQGITYFLLDMRQPGVEVRPLREMTGRAVFNEVYLTEATVPNDAVLGGLHNGWAVANTTLAVERAGLGVGGGGGAMSPARPGQVAGDLDRRVGDFVESGRRMPARGGQAAAGAGDNLRELARRRGVAGDASVRQGLAELHTLQQIGRYTALRLKALRAAGDDLPGAGNLAKLGMSRLVRLSRELHMHIVGPYGTLHAYDTRSRHELERGVGDPLLTSLGEAALFSPAPSIYGGTDEVQRNVIGERVLGLPKEPGDTRDIPFRQLPKNV